MVEAGKKVDEHGREIPDKLPRVAADAIVMRKGADGAHQVMLITRKKATF